MGLDSVSADGFLIEIEDGRIHFFWQVDDRGLGPSFTEMTSAFAPYHAAHPTWRLGNAEYDGDGFALSFYDPALLPVISETDATVDPADNSSVGLATVLSFPRQGAT